MTLTELPKSILTLSQTKTHEKTYSTPNGKTRLVVTLRYDDQCKNGHNTFAITAMRYGEHSRKGDCVACGCLHDDIARRFPELAPLIKWHLTSSDGPMHYLANTCYLASVRDCHGLLKGEFRQHLSRGQQNNGIPNVPNWVLRFPKGQLTDIYSNEKPAPITLEWEAYGRTGEGKEVELESARHAAIWPEATVEQLSSQEALLERLPALMIEFKQAMESLGFTY